VFDGYAAAMNPGRSCRTRATGQVSTLADPERAIVDAREGFEPLEHLRYIRETIEHSAAFTAVSGWGLALAGTSAMAVALVSWRVDTGTAWWLSLWLAEASIGATIALASMYAKSRRSGLPLFSGPGRKFAMGLMPAIVAGAIMTAVFCRAGMTQHLPSMWMLLYGAGVVAGGVWSVAPVPLMGTCFMLMGSVLIFSPAIPAGAAMAATFGLLHIIFGLIIVRRYGG
jgi:hypothetical protein